MLKAILEEIESIKNEEEKSIPMITSTVVESTFKTDNKPQECLNVKQATDTSMMKEGEVHAEKLQHCGKVAEGRLILLVTDDCLLCFIDCKCISSI